MDIALVLKEKKRIEEILIENNILFKHDRQLEQFTNDTNLRYRFDFIILDENNNVKCIIEFDGRQHFMGPDTNYWGRSTDTLETIQQRDAIKNKWCLNNQIPLYRIPYTQINQLTYENIFSGRWLVK